jgi:hypothetical protein
MDDQNLSDEPVKILESIPESSKDLLTEFISQIVIRNQELRRENERLRNWYNAVMDDKDTGTTPMKQKGESG